MRGLNRGRTRSALHNVAASFTSLMNQQGGVPMVNRLAAAGREAGESVFRADLLTGELLMPAFASPEVSMSLRFYREMLGELLAKHRGVPVGELVSAELELVFDFVALRPAPRTPGDIVPFRCEVRVVDRYGHPHVGFVEERVFVEGA
jgi:hypothetical protein